MKAIRLHETGGPEVLRFEDIPTPQPGLGEVLVRIQAAGVNFIDTYHRGGLYPIDLPFVLGREGAGRVEALGPGVSSLAVGDSVAWGLAPAGYAECAALPAANLARIPAGVDAETAAAVMLQGMTAHYLLFDTFPVTAGHTILVHAAAGGVGLLLVQMAKRLGARVIGTVSTEEKADLARANGADEVILYTKEDFETETRRLTGGEGVHVVYDGVGQSTFDKGLRCLRARGMMALFGQASGPVGPFDPQRLNRHGSRFLTRPSLGHYIAAPQEFHRRAKDLFTWIAGGELAVHIDRRFPLSEAADAHRYLEGRQSRGKILLIP